MARQIRMDAILLDLSLPGLHGWETLRQLKNDRRTSMIPIIVLSAFGAFNDPEIEQSADAWLQKPLQEDLLLAALTRVLHAEETPGRVLLIEDNNDLAKVMQATLERAGLDVCHAPTRRKALEMCVTAPPNLIVLDPALPDGDGFSLVDWLRGQKDLSQIPLVVYSARDIDEEERKKLMLGPTEFLTKARVQPREVETVVLTMLRRRHAAVEDNLHWDGAASANL